MLGKHTYDGTLRTFAERAPRLYPTIDPSEVRLVPQHPGPRILPDVSDERTVKRVR